MFTPINGQLIHGVSFGSGPHTLLAHGGWIGNWELWLQPMELLSGSWRTVAYDHRGAGETKTDPAAITSAGLVDDVLGVMDAYGIERCVLASESAGAQAVIPALLRAPSRVEALVLVSGLFKRERTPQDATVLAAMQRDFPRFADSFVDLCLPEDVDGHLRRWGRDIVRRTAAERSLRLYEIQYEMDATALAAQVAVPTLIIHGTEDVIAPIAEARTLAERLPQRRLLELSGVGHVPTISRPREVADAIKTFVDDMARG